MTIYIDIIQTYRSGRIQKDRRYDTSWSEWEEF
jgi:hypothetical protein